MPSREEIHEAQQQVAEIQGHLDEVQEMLEAAEQIAAAGEVAKQRAQQLLVVSLVLVADGVLLLACGGRRKV